MKLNVGFLGLIFSGLILCLIGCVRGNPDLSTMTYIGRELGSSVAFDTLRVTREGDFFEMTESKYFSSGSFSIATNLVGDLVYATRRCDTFTVITMDIGSETKNLCEITLPFFSEWVTVLDSVKVKLNEGEFTVFKFFNDAMDSRLENSTVYWLKDFGVIYMVVGSGRYYELESASSTEMPVLPVRDKIKANVSFTERWLIPPAPPPPSVLFE